MQTLTDMRQMTKKEKEESSRYNSSVQTCMKSLRWDEIQHRNHRLETFLSPVQNEKFLK